MQEIAAGDMPAAADAQPVRDLRWCELAGQELDCYSFSVGGDSAGAGAGGGRTQAAGSRSPGEPWHSESGRHAAARDPEADVTAAATPGGGGRVHPRGGGADADSAVTAAGGLALALVLVPCWTTTRALRPSRRCGARHARVASSSRVMLRSRWRGRDPTLFGFELTAVLPGNAAGSPARSGPAPAASKVVRLWAKDEIARARWVSRIRARTLAPSLLSRLLLLAGPGSPSGASPLSIRVANGHRC